MQYCKTWLGKVMQELMTSSFYWFCSQLPGGRTLEGETVEVVGLVCLTVLSDLLDEATETVEKLAAFSCINGHR